MDPYVWGAVGAAAPEIVRWYRIGRSGAPSEWRRPGTASVSGNVLHNGNPVSGTVNVNFEKWNGSSWQTMSTAQRTLSNGHYSVVNWGVGVGQWRVRAVFNAQGDYAGSESPYREFTIR